MTTLLFALAYYASRPFNRKRSDPYRSTRIGPNGNVIVVYRYPDPGPIPDPGQGD